jgi:hypothetical protein
VRHTAARRDDALTTHHHGEPDHAAWLERPFTEALRALDDRSDFRRTAGRPSASPE